MKILKKPLMFVSLILVLAFTTAFFTSCKKSYEISFESNGGPSVAVVELEEGQTYELQPLTREGWSFEGWYATQDFTGEAVTTVTASADAKYYAKWEQMYKLTLDANGGTLSVSEMYLKAGANVQEAVKNLTPTKSGLTFGAWFVNGSALAPNTRMTSSGLTLTAEYKVNYTVELYLEALDGSGYVKAEDVITGSDYVGKEIVSEQTLTGFREANNDNAVTALTLSDTAANNVFKHYFDRNTLTVRFNPNYPDGSTVTAQSFTVKYGEEVTVPVNVSFEGYCLAGWSTSSEADAEVMYKANYIESVLFGGTGEAEADTFAPERTTTLYAVWNKGYSDMFGNDDYLYLVDAEGDEIYLDRGGVFFKGEYYKKDSSFVFYDSKGDILIEGVLREDGKFMYYSTSRDDYSATRYVVGVGLTDETVEFDAYNGITYKTAAGVSTGTYVIEENGYYTVTFTEGEYSGQTLCMIFGTVTTQNGRQAAFQVRNEYEYSLGQLVRLAISDGNLVYYRIYDITLDGFGNAYYNTGEETPTVFSYIMDAETNTVELISNGSSAGVLKILTFDENVGYCVYDPSMDQTYSFANGDQLILDGTLNATYVKDGQSSKGYYTVNSESPFGGYVIDFYDANGAMTRILATETSTEVPVTGEDGEITTEIVKTYSAEAKAAEYATYYYFQNGNIYYYPLLAINEPEVGKATLYGYTTDKKYVKFSMGDLNYDAASGLYTYTATTVFETEGELSTQPIDLSTVKSFVYALDSTATSYSVNYWHSYTDNEDVTTSNVVTYTGENETLTVVAGMGIFSSGGITHVGAIKESGAYTILQNSSVSIYFEVDKEAKTFVSLDHAPYKGYVIHADGSATTAEYVQFDGKGGAVYTIITENPDATEEEEKTITTTYAGTVEKLDKKSVSGFEVYRFTSTEKTFEYIMLAQGSYRFVSMYNEEYNGEYVSADGILLLDGYTFYASYTEATTGIVYEGRYIVAEENVIQFLSTDGQTIFFDLKENKSFSARGREYATYLHMENQGINGIYYSLDGYGNVQVYTMQLNAEDKYEAVYLDENGTYTVADGIITINYTSEDKQITVIGELSTYVYEQTAFNVIVVHHNEAAMTFVNEEDWSVFTFSNNGTAVKYTSLGVKELGSYMIIAKNLLYYANEAGTDASVYTFNTESKTIACVDYKPTGYYTTDLESLLFTQYGFAIFNGVTRYYYNIVDENGKKIVYIYHQDAENSNANEYGFIEERFGEFGIEKTYGDKTYYLNDGFALQFTRNEATKDKYPIYWDDDATTGEKIYKPLENLVFQPSGTSEFAVQGIVTINGTNYACVVTREIDEETGAALMYVTLGTLRFGIEVAYTGENEAGEINNTYAVVSMVQTIENALFDTYLQLYYMFQMWFGVNLPDTYGTLTVCSEYNEAGEIVTEYVTTNFLEGLGVVDANGEIINVERASYTYANGIYTTTVNHTDGFTYNIHFQLIKNSIFGVNAFVLVGFNKVETFKTADEAYTVTIETVIMSSVNEAGTIYDVIIHDGENEVELDLSAKYDGKIYIVDYTLDEEGFISAANYYTVTIQYEDVIVDEESEEDAPLPAIIGVTVLKQTATTYYTSPKSKTQYIDVIDETNKVLVFAYRGSFYLATDSTYDEATKTYTITSGQVQFIVTISEDGVATIEKVEVEEEEEA